MGLLSGIIGTLLKRSKMENKQPGSKVMLLIYFLIAASGFFTGYIFVGCGGFLLFVYELLLLFHRLDENEEKI